MQFVGGKRQAKTPFVLTPTEEEALRLYRGGMTHKQVASALGMKYHGSGLALVNFAAEKERLILLDDRHKCGVTSLSVARGKVRMEGTK